MQQEVQFKPRTGDSPRAMTKRRKSIREDEGEKEEEEECVGRSSIVALEIEK